MTEVGCNLSSVTYQYYHVIHCNGIATLIFVETFSKYGMSNWLVTGWKPYILLGESHGTEN